MVKLMNVLIDNVGPEVLVSPQGQGLAQGPGLAQGRGLAQGQGLASGPGLTSLHQEIHREGSFVRQMLRWLVLVVDVIQYRRDSPTTHPLETTSLSSSSSSSSSSRHLLLLRVAQLAHVLVQASQGLIPASGPAPQGGGGDGFLISLLSLAVGPGLAQGQGLAPGQGLAQGQGLAPGQGLAGSLSYHVLKELVLYCHRINTLQGQAPGSSLLTDTMSTSTITAAPSSSTTTIMDHRSVSSDRMVLVDDDGRLCSSQSLITSVLGQLARQALSVQSQMMMGQLILQTYGGALGRGLGQETGSATGLGKALGLGLGSGLGLGQEIGAHLIDQRDDVIRLLRSEH